MGKNQLYEDDFYAWSQQQAALLRQGKLAEADLEHIAEEIESMGRTEKRELISRLKVLLTHLLKWEFQPAGRGSSWETSIHVERNEIADHLEDNPSLKALIGTAIEKAYRNAVLEAANETSLPLQTFPQECPYRFDEIMDDRFWPEPPKSTSRSIP